jgi:hypothetical protein
MKKQRLFICILALMALVNCFESKAQTAYKSIFGNNSTSWNISFEQGDWYGTDSLRFVSDTVINLMNYKTIQVFGTSNHNEKYYVREDTVYGKYYIRNNIDINNEQLFMNMGLNVGDTFIIHQNSYFAPDSLAIVDSIVYINNLKVIKTNLPIYMLGHNQSEHLCFMESIGPNNGLNYLFQSFFINRNFGLICHFKDDTLYYHNSQAFESRPCFFQGGGFVPEYENSILKTIYPNPAQDIINLEFNSEFSGTLIIYNTYGQIAIKKELKNSPNQQIHVGDLPSGVYMIALKSDIINVHTSFVKQ